MSYEKNIVDIATRISAQFSAFGLPLILDVVRAAVEDIAEHGLTYEDGVEAKRMREENIIVRTTWNQVHQIEQIVGTPTEILQRRVLNTMEKQTRDGLIAMGWTPPPPKR